MTQSISSAVPRLLDRYATTLLAVDQTLLGATGGLAATLHHFEATCREYPVRVGHLPGLVQRHAQSSQGVDSRVRVIAEGFWLADQASLAANGVWVATAAALGSRSAQTTVEWLKYAKDFGYDGLWETGAKNLRAIRGHVSGVRFKPSTGYWDEFIQKLFTGRYRGIYKVTGSKEALKAMGHNPDVRRFGERYISKQLAVKPGPLSLQANGILRHIRIQQNNIYGRLAAVPAHLKDAFGVGHGIKGFFKSPAGIALVTTVAFNVYEFGFGESREAGLRSRQFVTATTADLVANGGIIAVSTAVGSVVPVAGTAVGFIVGVGLSYVYEKYAKDRWRTAVDSAAVKVTQSVTDAAKVTQQQVLRAQRDLARAAHTVADDIKNTTATTLHAAADKFGQFTTGWAFQT